MVVIHPFHCISEVARHSSALSHRQVADCDYRVPEVIDRHSYRYSAVVLYQQVPYRTVAGTADSK